jgi:hypothetical protein
MRFECVLVVLGLLICIQGKKFFGYYDALLNETGSYSTIYQAESIAAAVEAHAQGIQSLLSLYDTFFTSAPSRMILAPNWQQAWSSMADSAEPYLKSGVLLGFNLGDELVWNCLAPSNLTIVANAVRQRFPRNSAIIWYNEATPPISAGVDGCGHSFKDYSIPAALDWFSTDIYHMDGVVTGWVDRWVRSFYDQYIFPHLTPNQSVILVPGSFGSDVNHYPNGTYVCDRACYDIMCAHDAADFMAWANSDARVAGVFPWNWAGCPSCNGSRWTPPHTCCMDELGTRVQPRTRDAWQHLALQLK